MGKDLIVREGEWNKVNPDTTKNPVSASLATTLSSFIDSCREVVPRLVDKVNHLQQGIRDGEFEDLMKEKGAVHEDILSIIRSIENYANHEEAVDRVGSIICNDRTHRCRGKLLIFAAFQDYLGESRDKNKSWERERHLAEMNAAFWALIEDLQSLNDLDVNIQKESRISEVLPFVFQKFKGISFDIDEKVSENLFVACNAAILRSMLNELKENYRKYGMNGKLSMKIADNVLQISLSNNKKEKWQNDYSSSSGLKILGSYLGILGGVFYSNYETDECITTISIPLAKR